MRLESENGFKYDEESYFEPLGFQKILEAKDTESGEVLELQIYDPDPFDSIFNVIFTSYDEGLLKVKSGIESPNQVSGYVPVDEFNEVKKALDDEGFDIATRITGSEAYLAELT